MLTFEEVARELDQIVERRSRVERDLTASRARREADPSAGHSENVARLQEGAARLELREAELRQELGEKAARRLEVARLAQDPRNREPGANFRSAEGADHGGVYGGDDRGSLRSQALRCNERADFLPERAREHMER